jgi:hypothetical protein
MSKPEQFISTTDFPTIKNSVGDTTTLTLSIPATFTVPAGAYNSWTTSTTATIGQKGAMIRSTIKSSKLGSQEFIAHNLYESRVGDYAYYLIIDVYRDTPTTVTAVAYIPNIFNPGYLATPVVSQAETITIKLSTFLSPFE